MHNYITVLLYKRTILTDKSDNDSGGEQIYIVHMILTMIHYTPVKEILIIKIQLY